MIKNDHHDKKYSPSYSGEYFLSLILKYKKAYQLFKRNRQS